MNSEHDSVAVIAEDLRTMADRVADYGISGMSGRASLIAVASRLERLTREAAPQASGGDGVPYGIIDPDYARVFTIARCLAWAEGYALALHGSFTRDLDLIAIPWTDSACEPDHLARRIEDAAGMRITTPGKEGEKPHGRLVWTLKFTTFGDPRFVDLSIMPRITTPDSAIQSQQGATGGADANGVAQQAAFWRAFCEDAENGTFPRVLLDDAHNMGAGALELHYRDALAHPQAAGSAPGEADSWPQWVKDAVRNANEAGRLAGRSEATPAAGAGAAPVGAEDLAERLTDLLRQEMPSESSIYRCVEMALAATPAIDAALEKERAE